MCCRNAASGREIGEAMRASGFNVVIENRTGAAGRLATEQLLSAPADGSVLVFMPSGNATLLPHIYPKLKFDPLRDLAPIATVCSFSFALAVGPGTPAKTLKEFVAWAKAHPAQASYGTPGGEDSGLPPVKARMRSLPSLCGATRKGRVVASAGSAPPSTSTTAAAPPR